MPRPRCQKLLGAVLAAMLLAAMLLVGCGGSPAGRLRFRNQPPVWRVNDRRAIKQPAQRHYAALLYFGDAYLFRRVPRVLAFRGSRRALGVNSLDEAPDSTWFINRIGRRDMSAAEVRRGPRRDESPELHRPWKIKSTKVGGASIGFIIEDRRGKRYLLKFDQKGLPEMETAAGIIVQRILHACGYNVPEDDIVYFNARDLRVAPGAVVSDTFGHKRPMTAEDVRKALARVNVGKDGRIRGLVSRFLPGVLLGGTLMAGTRSDDANDIIPHEHRRDVRGQAVIFGWLNHTDVKEANTLDVWAPDPRAPKHRYVMHYLIDFGKALGVMRHTERLRQAGWAYATDLKYMLLTLPTFGLWVRPWERLRRPAVPAVGLYMAKHYSPADYTPSFPYFAFSEADRFDAFWGAKIMARLTRAHLKAAIAAARYSDPRSAKYMLDVLLARQRATVRHWFERVTPLDRFTVSRAAGGHRICFEDMALRFAASGAAAQQPTRYEAEAYDYRGTRVAWTASDTGRSSGRACVGGLRLPATRDGYAIIRIVTKRGGRRLPAVDVHVARPAGGGEARVIGLRRH